MDRLPPRHRKGDGGQDIFLQGVFGEAVDLLEGPAADNEAGACAEGLVAEVLQVDEGLDGAELVGHAERVGGGDVVEALEGAGEAGVGVGEEVGDDGTEPVRGRNHVHVEDGEQVCRTTGECVRESGAEV